MPVAANKGMMDQQCFTMITWNGLTTCNLVQTLARIVNYLVVKIVMIAKDLQKDAGFSGIEKALFSC